MKGKSALRTKTKDNKRGPSKKKTAATLANNENDSHETSARNRLDQKRHQQLTLNIFKNTFASVLSSDSFTTTLQTIKQALFERDFAKAFGDPDALAVYAARWSPTRALGYESILNNIYKEGHLQEIILPTVSASNSQPENTNDQPLTSTPNKANLLKVLCIGGGAAEIVAFGSFLSHIHHSPISPDQDENANNPPLAIAGDITLLDSGPWSSIVTQLQTTLTATPPLPKYASQALQKSNRPMIADPSLLTSRFLQQDALDLDKNSLAEIIRTSSGAPILTTLLFTLNELFTASGIGKTTTFLLNLTARLPIGSLLLVVDSPGSYSETSVGSGSSSSKKKAEGEEVDGTAPATKKYPMQWLLDKILLNTETDSVEGKAWVKLESHDSLWFRLPEQDAYGDTGLEYPISLENMRYQMHLYRVVDVATLN